MDLGKQEEICPFFKNMMIVLYWGWPRYNLGLGIPFFFFFFFLLFLGPHPWHMEVPRLEVKSEL